MRRRYIAVLLALSVCLCAVPAAYAAGPPASRDAPAGETECLQEFGTAPLGAQKDPAEGTSAGGTVRYAQGTSGQSAELRITTPEALPKAGETFTVTVDIIGNPGFASVEFTLPYDKEAMECTSANTGELMQGMLAGSNADAPTGAIVAGVAMETIRGDGRLAVFTFIAKNDLSSSNFQLTEVELANEDGVVMPCTVTYVKTKAPAPPEEQRDLEKEAEAVVAELEGEVPPRREENTPAQSPADSQPPAAEQPEETAPPTFTDMAGHWAEEDVSRAAELGLIGGYVDGTFKPDNSLTRAQFVTILYRQAGRPEVTATTPFTDIANVNEEFRTAIAWAYEKKLVDGTTPTTFNPNGVLSKQATMKILFQHSGGFAGLELMFYGVYDEVFPDSGQMAQWARAPMYWGIYNTLIEAGEGDRLNPTETVTRAHLARAMVRYIERFGEEETA